MLDMFPPALINGYMWDQFQIHMPTEVAGYKNIKPFFPVYDNKGADATWGSNPYVVYDIMSRFQMSPFYPVKREHMLYSIRGPIERMMTWRSFIIEVLDRGDDAGKDINEWVKENVPESRVRFHDLRVFGMEFARDTTKRAAVTNNNFFVAEEIIDYRFHIVNLFNE